MSENGENVKIAYRVSALSIFVNIALSAIKLVAGIFAGSSALVSDAVHSLSDVFSTVVVIIGVKLSSKADDEDHQYGHERIECIAALILASVLMVTGIGIGFSGVKLFATKEFVNLERPHFIALLAAALSIVVKEAMYWYTRSAARKLRSDALMADAWHHRSDALSSVGSVIGVGGAMLGFEFLDPLASIIICLFIIKAAFDIYKDAVSKLTDRSASIEVTAGIREIILKNDKVLGIDVLKTRLFSSKIYVDVEISLDGNMTLFAAHQTAQEVHDEIERNFQDVKHCMIHVNPYNAEK
ncbi:MAG: cation diffusion facilitator family transporter [Ruminococcus sp.]|nr:cation diffusion facilitator family transporter [Ruminococcus sp.]